MLENEDAFILDTVSEEASHSSVFNELKVEKSEHHIENDEKI